MGDKVCNFYLGEQIDEKWAPLRLLLPALHLLLFTIMQFSPVHLAIHELGGTVKLVVLIDSKLLRIVQAQAVLNVQTHVGHWMTLLEQ